jgi:hypothetical protein
MIKASTSRQNRERTSFTKNTTQWHHWKVCLRRIKLNVAKYRAGLVLLKPNSDPTYVWESEQTWHARPTAIISKIGYQGATGNQGVVDVNGTEYEPSEDTSSLCLEHVWLQLKPWGFLSSRPSPKTAIRCISETHSQSQHSRMLLKKSNNRDNSLTKDAASVQHLVFNFDGLNKLFWENYCPIQRSEVFKLELLIVAPNCIEP